MLGHKAAAPLRLWSNKGENCCNFRRCLVDRQVLPSRSKITYFNEPQRQGSAAGGLARSHGDCRAKYKGERREEER